MWAHTAMNAAHAYGVFSQSMQDGMQIWLAEYICYKDFKSKREKIDITQFYCLFDVLSSLLCTVCNNQSQSS